MPFSLAFQHTRTSSSNSYGQAKGAEKKIKKSIKTRLTDYLVIDESNLIDDNEDIHERFYSVEYW